MTPGNPRVEDSRTAVNVTLGARSYPIIVERGGLAGLGSQLAEILAPNACVIVSNPMVGAIYAHAAAESLGEAGFDTTLVYVPDGEAAKTLSTWENLVDDLLTIGIDRRTPIVALGGGVTGDIVGFAAASVLRGVPLVQVPTTLLAMVDSSVGGKTGVNTRQGKNLVGAFHQPVLVYAPIGVLATLDNAEMRCGLGEAVKYGVIRDEELLRCLVDNADALIRRDPETLAWVVQRCCEVKAAIVSADEREAGIRTILNYGHTVGHALETALGHGRLRHGEAVAIGMLTEARFARERQWLDDPSLVERLEAVLKALGLPTSVPADPGLDRDEFILRLVKAAWMDKKRHHGTLSLVVPIRIGEVGLKGLAGEELPDLFEHLSWDS